MTIQTRPLEVTDFSGGITDYFIDGSPMQAERMDNLIITPNKKAQTRPGSQLFVAEQIPLGEFRINALALFNDEIIAFSQRRAYRNNGGVWEEIEGPPSSGIFPDGDANSMNSITEWQGHLFLANDAYSSIQKMYVDEFGNYQVRNAGLPEIPSGVSITNPPGVGESYLYAFVFRYDYKVGSVSFLDRGPVFNFPTTVTGGTITSGNGANITLPTSLPIPENWDEANFEIEIYRTISTGSDYFLVDTVSFGTANYLDEVEDATLQLQEALYTTGGIFSNDTPPKAKFVHVVNDTGYYANVNTGSEFDEYTVRQSITGDPDSVPESFFASTEQKIKGLSSIFDRPIVLCDRYIYRIDNIIGLTGTGDMNLRRIDDRAGCVSNSSIVQTHLGLFWAGEVGFYWSDGFKVLKISDNINESYKAFVQNDTRKKRISGAYDASNNRVIWSVCKEDGGNEPDQCIVLDLKWGVREQSTFTTWSNSTFFKPTAWVVRENQLYRGDTRGYVLEHDVSYFTDPKIDTTVLPANWEVSTIIHEYKSCFLDFGSKFYRKFVPRVLVSAGNTTNLSLGIASSNDNNRVQGTLKPIRYTANITWGDDLPLWGDPAAQWNYQGIIEEWRRFPAQGLRCNYKQIIFTNAQVQILTSELLGTVTIDATAKTATLGGSFQWINNVVDYVLKFESDDYQEEYVVTARTPTTLTFADPEGRAQSGTYKFILEGKPKGEVLALEGYILHWAYLSKSHTPFSASSLGSTP
jgi:hypothetical protein